MFFVRVNQAVQREMAGDEGVTVIRSVLDSPRIREAKETEDIYRDS